MTFQTVEQLLTRFKGLGAVRVFCKRLAENDNSKQQIYLGGKFEVLTFFPHGEITAHSTLSAPNFKAPLALFWVTADGMERAEGAQLILYPAYPEVRLSGFLKGCKSAPSEYLRPIPREHRHGADGRVLVFGTTAEGHTLACLAPAGSPLANEIRHKFEAAQPDGLFFELTLPLGSQNNRALVLNALRQIHLGGFHESCRRTSEGKVMPYTARNGGGYTLEALLGINPNSRSEPDYLGWEIKAHSSSRITLMTPEPNGGFYGEKGAKAFVERYGHPVEDRGMYFTGNHQIGIPAQRTGLTLEVSGFDPVTAKVSDVAGVVRLVDSSGVDVASWGFAQLLGHWNRKHAFAAYMRYSPRPSPLSYRYETPVLMGEHTDFSRFLGGLSQGSIIFDPGTKVLNAGTPKSTVKARSQFRIAVKDLGMLYQKFSVEKLAP